jgi:hemolysin activation/secretion protein
MWSRVPGQCWPWRVLPAWRRETPRLRPPHSLAWAAQLVGLCIVSLSVILSSGATVAAQERLGVEPPRRPGPVEPSFPTPPAPAPLLRPELPPVPPPPPEEQQRLPAPRVFVRQIRVTGNTVFSAEDVAAVTNAYANRTVTSEELEALRLALTRLYVNAGYINSGAVLPDQTVTDGVITFHIIEGALTSVTVEGNRWFREGYLRQRLALDIEAPLNIGTLQERLQLVQQDDRIERLEAELRPGVQLGESVLHVRVAERLPFFVALEFNNYQSPTVGAERGLLTVAHRNLTGNGDPLSVTYGRSAGLDLQLDTSYTLPLTARETTVSLRYRRNDSSVVEARFAPLDIASRSEIFTLTLRHPLSRTLRQEFALALSGEHLQSQTFLLGEPFSFSPGADNGEATDTAVRVVAEWLDRTPNQVLALRSRFSLGVAALGATIHNNADLPDGRFFAWLGQVQWGRRLPVWDIELLVRLDVQLTTEPLLPLEQLAIGGRFSVRGYRENQLVRDNGLLVSLESRLPLIRNTRWAEFVQVVPFVDFGRGWNRTVDTPDPTTLVSIGLGMRWAATVQTVVPLRAQFEVFWGYKLQDVETEGGNLQDHGLHLQLVVAAF